jgi:drug/metabolite transporter (DMT)-like permease
MTPWEIAGCVLVFVAVVLSQIPVPVKAKNK